MKFSKYKVDKMFRLAYKLAFETKTKSKNWDDIFPLWYCCATWGHKRAQFYLATCYDHGNGTDKNIELAYKWFLKAAKQGHMESQYNIGFFYAHGDYVKQAIKKGFIGILYLHLRVTQKHKEI